VKVRYLESHKSFCKLSLKIHCKKFNLSLSYERMKFEIWTSKLLFSIKKILNKKKTIIFKVHKKIWSSKSFQKTFLNINVTTPYYHSVFIQEKILYQNAWNPYLLIMDCYRFLGIFVKFIILWQFKNYSKN